MGGTVAFSKLDLSFMSQNPKVLNILDSSTIHITKNSPLLSGFY